MSNREKWSEYDLAESDLLTLISYYSKIIDEEERGPTPDMDKIALWENEQHALKMLKRGLSVDNQVAIANIRAKYGPIAYATLQKTRAAFQKT